MTLEYRRGHSVCGVSPWIREHEWSHQPGVWVASHNPPPPPTCAHISARGAWNEGGLTVTLLPQCISAVDRAVSCDVWHSFKSWNVDGWRDGKLDWWLRVAQWQQMVLDGLPRHFLCGGRCCFEGWHWPATVCHYRMSAIVRYQSIMWHHV